MNTYDFVWGWYVRLVRALRVLPIWRIRIGALDLGQRTDRLIRRVMPRIRHEVILRHKRGFALIIPEGYQSAHLYTWDDHESEVTQLLLRLLRKGMTFVDAGAHLGYYTLLASRLVGDEGKVFAFEADPNYCDFIERSVKLNEANNVRIVNKAIGSDSGVVTLFSDPRGASGNLYRALASDWKPVLIDATTLDAFFEQEGWPGVHVMKMDIEGSETSAIHGMSKLARRNRDLRLITEFAPRCLEDAEVAPVELFSAISQLGFVNISVIERDLCAVDAAKIPWLVREASRDIYLNLLCEKA